MRPIHRAGALTLLLLFSTTIWSDTDDLPRVQVGRIGKAATALVECQHRLGKGHGSAFCIHPSGLFVTNEHVVRDAVSIQLVLDPALPSQKVVRAQLLRQDRDADLALLRVEGVKNLPALTLGSVETISELMEVIAFGFPFGKALTVVRDDYPAVSVNAGSVTSLRRVKGELHRIQVDAALNPGNSGGPVLDRKGKVVGVVVAGVRGSGVNFVIPVSSLARFLERPQLDFTPPQVAHAARHRPAPFAARAVSVVPGGQALELELTLESRGKIRRMAMKRDGEVYRASAVPIPTPEGPVTLRVSLAFSDGSISGTVRDRTVRIGGKEVRLSDVRVLRFQGRTGAELTDGRALAGILTGLHELEVELGKASVQVKTAAALSATFQPADGGAMVRCTVIARQGGKEVARSEGVLRFAEPIVPGAIAALPGVQEAILEAAKVVRKLPAPVADAVIGGGGRYLILHLPKLRRLAVFDVTAARVSGYIPAGSETVRFSAGASKLVLALVEENVLQRYDLATLKRELAVPAPTSKKIAHVALGSASEGPIALTAADHVGECQFLDLTTLRPLPITFGERAALAADERAPLRVSADGRVFAQFRPHLSPQGVHALVIEGNQARGYGNGDSSGHVIPGDDGRLLFTGRGIYTAQAKPVGKVGREGLYCLPAVRGPYHLGLRINGEGMANRHRAHVFLAGDSRPVLTLKDIDWPRDMNEWDRERFAMDRRIWFLPEAKVLLTIPDGLDQLVLHRLDIEEALQKSDLDYLLVTSRPPSAAVKGAVFRYPLVVRSKKGGVQYEVALGPVGMEVTPKGEVRWTVPAGFKEKSVEVLVGIRDASAQEVFHRFTLRIE